MSQYVANIMFKTQMNHENHVILHLLLDAL